MNVNGSSLAQGLQFYMTADLMDTNLVTGLVGSIVGTVLPVSNAKGTALHFANSVANYITFPSITLITQPFSAFVRLHSPTGTAGTESFISFGGSGAGKGWTLRTNAGGFILTLGAVANYSLGSGFPNTHYWDFCMSATTSTVDSCLNGVMNAQVALGTVSTPASTPLVIGAAHNNVAYVQSCDLTRIGIAAVWNRALSNDELVAMCIDPYSVLDSGSPTGAGGVPVPFPRFDGNPFAGVS